MSSPFKGYTELLGASANCHRTKYLSQHTCEKVFQLQRIDFYFQEAQAAAMTVAVLAYSNK